MFNSLNMEPFTQLPSNSIPPETYRLIQVPTSHRPSSCGALRSRRNMGAVNTVRIPRWIPGGVYTLFKDIKGVYRKSRQRVPPNNDLTVKSFSATAALNWFCGLPLSSAIFNSSTFCAGISETR